ncbi:MAG: TonB-dependent receptor [Calditrichaeota bacterium]|nr:MAG: TonB-dependent receptor [Calditrichota bacterium]
MFFAIKKIWIYTTFACSIFVNSGILFQCVLAQNLKISGQITDAESGVGIDRVIIFIDDEKSANYFYSDKNGKFVISLPQASPANLIFYRMGYRSVERPINISNDTSFSIILSPKPLPLPDVTITSDKEPRLLLTQKSPHAVTRFSARKIEETLADSPADVLTYAPGIFIKNYGGMGGLQTVSLRGLSATQSKILIDGVAFDNYQSGVVDFSTLDITAFQNINIFRGGDAARFGANALAGIINLQSHGASGQRSLKISESRGQYGLHALRFRATGKAPAGISTAFAGAFRQAEGDHRYRFNAFGDDKILRRSNAAFQNLNLLSSFQKEGEKRDYTLSFMYHHGDREIPNAVLQGSFVESEARQKDKYLVGTAIIKWRFSPGKNLHSALRWQHNELHYRDPLIKIKPGGINDRYKTRSLFYQSEYEWTARKFRLLGKLETGFSELTGNNLTNPGSNSFKLIDSVQRIFTHAATTFEYINETDQNFLALQFGLRRSEYSDVGGALSPSTGINWKPFAAPLHLRMHAAHNFRVPTFAEQYYLNYGTQKLKPETSYSVDFGANYTVHHWGNWFADIAVFALNVRDQIISVPRSPVVWSAQNIGKTRTIGLEWQGEWQHPNELLRLRTTYTLQQAEDQTPGSRTFGKRLIYIPQGIATMIATASLPFRARNNIFATLAVRHLSYRYSLPENDFDSLMPTYTLWDLKTGYSFPLAHAQGQINLQIENITDKSYEIIHNYPMPMRMWRLEIEVKI